MANRERILYFVRRSPPVKRTAQRVRHYHHTLNRTLSRYKVRWQTYWRCGRKHRAEIDPFRLLWIDPRRIETGLKLNYSDYAPMRRRFDVKDGDWDLACIPLRQLDLRYASFEAHFMQGVPWPETPLYQEIVDAMHKGDYFYRGCRTTEALDARLAQVDALHTFIRQHGYKSQAELERMREAPLVSSRDTPPELDEIVIGIGRTGEFIFIDGIHRLSIAQFLCVPLVPVSVLLRHKRWQEHRDAVYQHRFELGEETFNHPDLAYLRQAHRSRR